MRAAIPLLLLLVLGGCARHRAAGPDLEPALPREVAAALEAARALLEAREVVVGGRSFRADCSGFVSGAYSAGGVQLAGEGAHGRSGTELIFRTLRAGGRILASDRPLPGDLAFFHDTYDRNRNGLRDDRFTHVALVENVDADGTVHYLHFASGRVKRGVLHPRRRDEVADADGKVLNSYLRRGKGRVLAGDLLLGFGRPVPR